MKTAEYHDIFHNQAEEYEQLVAREDYESNILPALNAICRLNGRVVVDLGTGTGRLLKLMAPQAKFVYGFDSSPAMLTAARSELQRNGLNNWGVAAADHRHLPLAANSCDLIVSGWSLCYLALDQGKAWRKGLAAVLRRLRQLTRPGGCIIILETMGTGFSEPNPPGFMIDYFGFLVEIGMQSTWIRTDYQFESLEEAIRLTRFFFGDDLAQQVEQDGSPSVPECTGIWWSNELEGLWLD